MENLKDVDIVFMTLVYKNYIDLEDFIDSIQKKIKIKYAIVIVNSFFDLQTSLKIKKIAKKYNCDLIEVDNKGYSYGNNRGIEYIEKYYSYRYLFLCNPDIIIKRINLENLRENTIYGPNIVTLTNKRQNPFNLIYLPISERISYMGYKKDFNYLWIIQCSINKVIRELFFIYDKIINKSSYKVYSIHGACVIFPKKIINKYFPIYNEDMFLYGEESYLAYSMKKRGVKFRYIKDIEIVHKEDGSMQLSNINISREAKKSALIYYESKKMFRRINWWKK